MWKCKANLFLPTWLWSWHFITMRTPTNTEAGTRITCFEEDYGRTLELLARRAIECAKLGELFCGRLEDMTAEKNADNGALACDNPEGSKKVKDSIGLLCVVS